MKKIFRDQKGFSLVELLIAVSILAVGLLAAAAMQGVAMNSNSLANRISTASMIAQMVTEEINSWPSNDARLKAADFRPYNFNLNPATPPQNSLRIEGSGTYSAEYTITPGMPFPESTRIDVAVTREDSLTGPNEDITNRGERRIITFTMYKRTI